jgi:membrane-bound ClpP family serine protease
VVFDPEAFDPEGLTHIDWYRVSPDGETIAMSLSRAGSEVGDLHIIDRKTGEGRVRVETENWRATTDGDPIPEGVEVRVVEIRGTRMVVEPM